MSDRPDLPPSPGAPLHIGLTDQGDVVAAVPYLLGFHPADSLVALMLVADGNREILGRVVRTDLPDPSERVPFFRHLAAVAGDQAARAVSLLVVGGLAADGGEPLPHRALVDVLRVEYGAQGCPRRSCRVG
ncbi:DUF4192 family protein [Actinokineospora sp.]|uniref:DUF4192 family protein n=1 Tax=Actinokineospora sp. TaxID=1872133 RepID=UPI004037F72D